MIAYAAPAPTNIQGIIGLFTDIGLELIPLLGAIAFLAFVLGVARFIKSSGSDEKKDSKNLLIWGIVGMLVLTTIWGIISFLKSEFGFGSDVPIPQIKMNL